MGNRAGIHFGSRRCFWSRGAGYAGGYVEDITLRHVEIRTYFNERIYIPNAMAASSKIINFTKAEGYSHTIDVSIAYESDIGKAIGIMKDVIIHHPKYQGDGEPSVLCKEAGESGILLRGVVSTGSFADNPGACSDCLMEIIRRYAEEGIEIPYNKLEIVNHYSNDYVAAGGCAAKLDPRDFGGGGKIDHDIYFIEVRESDKEAALETIRKAGLVTVVDDSASVDRAVQIMNEKKKEEADGQVHSSF